MQRLQISTSPLNWERVVFCGRYFFVVAMALSVPKTVKHHS